MAAQLVRRAISRVPALSPVATATLLRSHTSKSQQKEPASNSQIHQWYPDSPQKSPFGSYEFYRDHSGTDSSDIESYDDSKSPAISHDFSIMGISLSELHEMCDLCEEPTRIPGSPLTFINADKIVDVRHNAEIALKFYNDTKSKNFKLVKVCKASYTACTFCGMIFRAREDGSEECPLFRGVVYQVGGRIAAFCEIKDDDEEITLLPSDDDYVSSK